MDINKVNIDLCIAKDRSAQKEIYGTLLPYLNIICQRYLIDDSFRSDVLQEVFIHIFSNIKQYDTKKASFKTWSTKIAINCCLKSNIKHSKNATQELILPLHETLIAPEVIGKLSNEDLLNWLRKMPSTYFEVFNLFIVDGFSHKEIAELLGIDEALSRQRFSRSRAWLKKKLPSDYKRMFNLSSS